MKLTLARELSPEQKTDLLQLLGGLSVTGVRPTVAGGFDVSLAHGRADNLYLGKPRDLAAVTGAFRSQRAPLPVVEEGRWRRDSAQSSGSGEAGRGGCGFRRLKAVPAVEASAAASSRCSSASSRPQRISRIPSDGSSSSPGSSTSSPRLVASPQTRAASPPRVYAQIWGLPTRRSSRRTPRADTTAGRTRTGSETD
ncbi:hypothetical protein DIPPA_14014 [Diplonema papillatum]|nr:hypothetical protein DIPPA_14014 [Diplonema papillatum]